MGVDEGNLQVIDDVDVTLENCPIVSVIEVIPQYIMSYSSVVQKNVMML